MNENILSGIISICVQIPRISIADYRISPQTHPLYPVYPRIDSNNSIGKGTWKRHVAQDGFYRMAEVVRNLKYALKFTNPVVIINN